MTEPSAHRTLVKSPPELWAEISEPEALARHLGEFGEIRITRLEPETTVAWEGERASGTVHLEPSSWGTKVTLTASVTAPARPAEPARVAQPEPVAEAKPVVEAEPVAEPEPVAEAPRGSRWSRFLRRRPEAVALTEPEATEPDLAATAPGVAEAEPEAAEPEAAEPEATEPEPVEPEAVEPERAAPEQAGAEADEIVAKLGAVLDDLGSAHHRPFSR